MNWNGYDDVPCDVWGCTQPATHEKLETWGFWQRTKRKQRCAGHADSTYRRRYDAQWFYKADT